MSARTYRIIIVVFGILPCLFTSPLWGLGIIVGAVSLAEQSFWMFLPWGISGLAGLIFFVEAYRRRHRQENLTRLDYISGVWGLCGAIAITIGLSGSIKDTDLQTEHIVLMLSILPIAALIIAVVFQHRPNHHDRT